MGKRFNTSTFYRSVYIMIGRRSRRASGPTLLAVTLWADRRQTGSNPDPDRR